MKLSITWLNKFLSLDDITSEEVASKLTMGSFEVEEIHKFGPKLKGPIVVGKILDIRKHPNADRLTVIKVTTDSKNELQIICGATNIKVGQMVPVSLPGAVVVNRHDSSELAIKKAKIREIESYGMLCSPSELGIKTIDPDGILILPDDAKLGQNVIDYLSLNEDTVLEVAARSNRGDALSVYGLSKEISALTKKKLKQIEFKVPKIDKSVQNIGSKIENFNDTYLFYTVTIEDITVSESPSWLQKLLDSVGIRCINNIVDITNYINFSFGQPLHAYDRAKLSFSSNKRLLTSRTAKNGEKIETIDGKTRFLKEGALVISDEEKPVAIAGIMGGKESEVTGDTKDIVLEAAVFNPLKVRRGSRTVGLSSEASKRFERGVDSNFTYKALLKAIELIEELASTNTKKPKVGEIQQAGEPLKEEVKIQLSLKEVKRVLGIDLTVKEIKDFLESLEFNTKSISEEKIETTVPSSRVRDVTRPIDLIEEIARLYGYDRIPPEPPPATLASNKSINSIEKVKSYFLAAGFSETYLSSLIGEQILNYKEFTFDTYNSVTMINPLSQEHSILRKCLIPGLIEALKLNQSYQTTCVKLFEIGKVYFLNKSKVLSEKETGVTEKLKLAGIISGYEESWFLNQNFPKKSLELLFFSAKGVIENMFTRYHCKFDFINTNEEFLNSNFGLKILLNNIEIGVFGCLHPKILKSHKLLGDAVVFEISLEPIISEIERTKTFEKISSQPSVERDITIDLPKKYSASTVKAELNKITSQYVTDVSLISVYELDKENRSLTYRLKMQDFEQTLTSKQVEDEVNKIKKHLTACLHAKFRV